LNNETADNIGSVQFEVYLKDQLIEIWKSGGG